MRLDSLRNKVASLPASSALPVGGPTLLGLTRSSVRLPSGEGLAINPKSCIS